MRAVERLLERERFDEVIISTLPERVSAWLKRDVPTRVERLGVPPMTGVRARERRTPRCDLDRHDRVAPGITKRAPGAAADTPVGGRCGGQARGARLRLAGGAGAPPGRAPAPGA